MPSKSPKQARTMAAAAHNPSFAKKVGIPRRWRRSSTGPIQAKAPSALPLRKGSEMGSQSDLDQGGTFRQYERYWMGPSVGWVTQPQQAVLPITAAGTVAVSRGTNLITLNVNGSVTLNLPSAKASPQSPQAIPGQWVLIP